MTKFETNRTYTTRSICDSECMIDVRIVKRTAKTVTDDSGKTYRVKEFGGVETFKPWGSYSMAPIIRAA
jgi:hypothetical protein